MKNYKVVYAFLPLVIFAIVSYFSTIAYSSENPLPVVGDNSHQCTCGYKVHIPTTGPCATGSYNICVNGVSDHVTGDFLSYLPCNGKSTICVSSSNGCVGTLIINVGSGPCGITDVYLTFSGQGQCDCPDS
ncbi:MAG: hypothetical protein JST55_02335 [Bacteroidetes bacterium]|nr:hypothetical protein [Bacteroidota bacterium]